MADPGRRYRGQVTRFEDVPVVTAGPALSHEVRVWATSQAMTALVKSFGGSADMLDGATGEVLERLDHFSDRWDGRGGKERNEARGLDLTPAQEELVLAAAEAFGMVHARKPSEASYDHVFVLGGLVRACAVRPAYAAQLLRGRTVTTAAVTALGGHRPFRGDEFDVAAHAGLSGVSEEFEALDRGTTRAFGLGHPAAVEGEVSPLPGGTWSVHRYQLGDGMPVTVAAAPSSEPAVRRANTGDTYAWFARELASLSEGQSLLAVTTSIYVPAQQAAAVRMLGLPYRVRVETVGVPTAEVPAGLEQSFTPSHYLQEVRSAIRAHRTLWSEVEGKA